MTFDMKIHAVSITFFPFNASIVFELHRLLASPFNFRFFSFRFVGESGLVPSAHLEPSPVPGILLTTAPTAEATVPVQQEQQVVIDTERFLNLVFE